MKLGYEHIEKNKPMSIYYLIALVVAIITAVILERVFRFISFGINLAFTYWYIAIIILIVLIFIKIKNRKRKLRQAKI
jgi:hypothetical protein